MELVIHELHVSDPIAYPGGKNGWRRAWCSCDTERLWWGATPDQALKPAREHKKAKEAAEAEVAEMARPASEFRASVLQYLTGHYAYGQRPDLAERLTDGEFVVLTYRELADIVFTVSDNRKQR